jgi:hypothetical protein
LHSWAGRCGGWDIFQRHLSATGEIVFRKQYPWHLLKQEGFYKTLKNSRQEQVLMSVVCGGLWAGNCRPYIKNRDVPHLHQNVLLAFRSI